MRLEIGSAYTVVFLIMIIPLLFALQFYGQPGRKKPIPANGSGQTETGM